MFRQACVFLLLFHFGSGQLEQQRHSSDSGFTLDEKFSRLIEADKQCASICATRGASAGRASFDPENKICRCDLGRDADDLDVELMIKQAKALGMNLLRTKQVQIRKREIDNEYFIGQKYQKRVPGKPSKNKKFTTKAPKSKQKTKGKQRAPTNSQTTARPQRKFTTNPKLAEIHNQIEELRERLRAPRLGQRAAFGLEDLEERHKKLIEELQDKQRQRLKSRMKGKEEIVASPLKTDIRKQENGNKIKVDTREDAQHVAAIQQVHDENNSKMFRKSKPDIAVAPQLASSSTTLIPKSTKSLEIIASTTSRNIVSNRRQSSSGKSLVDPKSIVTQVKEKIDENKAKLQSRLAAESTNLKLTNALEKNRETVSSTLKQIKEKQEKIKNKLTPSTAPGIDIPTHITS